MKALSNHALFAAADLSQATLTSPAIDISALYGYSIQCIFTSSAIGVLAINGSNDEVPTGAQVVNWTQVDTKALSAPGSVMFNEAQSMYKWIQLVYTKTSGSGSLNANFNGKG